MRTRAHYTNLVRLQTLVLALDAHVAEQNVGDLRDEALRSAGLL